MTIKEIINELEGLGTEQNRKIYMRHGSGQNTFGVSFAHLKKIAKGIGKDQELAAALWESENVDARSLATMIIDPNQFTFKTAEQWIKELDYSLLIGFLAGVVAKTNFADSALNKWTKSKSPKLKECGYSLLSHMLKNGVVITPKELRGFLLEITDSIHQAPNQVRAAMNAALIAVGIYCSELSELAIKCAKQIGDVAIDYGETSCKTPDAVSSIQKALARKIKKN